MKIIIKDIPAKGLELAQDIEPVMIGLSDAECKCLAPLTVKGLVTRVENTVLAHVDVRSKFLLTCARCLEAFEKISDRELDFDYPIDPSMKVIDLGEDIRQEMIMDLPVRILCREDCKGICADCGANLNIEKCKCK